MRYSVGTFQSAIVDLSRQLAQAQRQCDQAEQEKAFRKSSLLGEDLRSAVLAKRLLDSETQLARCQAELAQVKAILNRYKDNFDNEQGRLDTEESWDSDGENALRLSGMFEKATENESDDSWMNAEEVLEDANLDSDEESFESTHELGDIVPSLSDDAEFDDEADQVRNDPFGDDELLETYLKDDWLGRRSSCAFMFQDLDEKITIRKSKMRSFLGFKF